MRFCYILYCSLLAICELLSESFYLKLVIICKNLFLSLVVVRLVIFFMGARDKNDMDHTPNHSMLSCVAKLWNKTRDSSVRCEMYTQQFTLLWCARYPDIIYSNVLWNSLFIEPAPAFQLWLCHILWFYNAWSLHNSHNMLHLFIQIKMCYIGWTWWQSF